MTPRWQAHFQQFVKNKNKKARLGGNSKYKPHERKAFAGNSFDFWLAQNRGRVFIIGKLQNAFGKKRPMPKLKPIRATKAGMSQCLDGAPAGQVQSWGRLRLSDDFDIILPVLRTSFFFQSSQEEDVAWARGKLCQVGVQLGGDDEAVVEAGAGKKFRHLQIKRRSFFLLQQGRCLGSIWNFLTWMIYSMIRHVLQQLELRYLSLRNGVAAMLPLLLRWFCAYPNAIVKWQHWCLKGGLAL